ncbi:MAG: hypothetical protein NVS2B3_03890 [Vulcanimicrobiaceae bacterium]
MSENVVFLRDQSDMSFCRSGLARESGWPVALPDRARAIDLRRLDASVDTLARTFDEARPYRHVVIENFLDDAAARTAATSYPSFDAMQIRFAGLVEARAMERRFELLDPIYRAIFDELHSPGFVHYLSRLTGIADLRSDPTLNGAGLHQARDGGQHNVHADENIHGPTGLYQRVNVLIYLNDGWQAQWGGALELWDRDMKHCVSSVMPAFNRCLIMEVHDEAYHGYPAMNLPPDITRKSLTCWFYSTEPHALQSTIAHPTRFRVRPKDTLDVRMKHYARNVVRLLRGGR